LLNVLPGPIAERLKVGTGVIADHYDTVSVLFADLVGFTERSLVLAADELVAVLPATSQKLRRCPRQRQRRSSSLVVVRAARVHSDAAPRGRAGAATVL
jgi:hypothetical protein